MNKEGDVVLIHYHDQPTIYARIEAIEPDIKKDWYQVTFLLLSIPSQVITWILREEYFNGAPFTMGGVPMLIEGVKPVQQRKVTEDARKNIKKSKTKSKVIPFKNDQK